MSFFRSAKKLLLQPFRNLTVQQRLLQILRLGCPIVTVAFAIAYLTTLSNIETSYVARINCGHLDVAYGLYKSLRSSLSSYSTITLSDADILPADGELTDSEIQILTLYTETQVADAAQYIYLGDRQFCMVFYETTYQSAHLVAVNVTTTCDPYSSGGLFDYRAILLEAGLDIILAYAYESDYTSDTLYAKRVAQRFKRYAVMKPIMIYEVLAQLAICLYGFVLYSNRGNGKDLSNIPTFALNGVAILSCASGIIVAVAAGIVSRELKATQSEVAKGIADYGVDMLMGSVYLAVLWCTASFAILTMFSWGLPLWCANPPEDGYNSDDEITYHYHDDPQDKSSFVARPYKVTRQLKRNKAKKAISRLFDDSSHTDSDLVRTTSVGDGYGETDPFASAEELGKNVFADDAYEHERVGLSSQMQSETELRRLGATITRKFSSRRKGNHRLRRNLDDRRDWLPEKATTHNLLYGDNLYFNHQYPQTLPGVSESGSLSRSTTLDKLGNRSRSNTNHSKSNDVLAQSHQNLLDPNMSHELENPTDNLSVLNEREMEMLDNNHFVNKIV